jgi:hypothetical protein
MEYFWNRNAWFLGTPRRRTELPANWILFRGESWISFNRKAAAVILNATPSVSGHFRNTMIAVESYFHTLLRNDPDLVIKHGKFMYVPWQHCWKGRGMWLRTEYLDEIRDSGAVFARKFNPAIDSEIVDLIDSAIDEARNSDHGRRSHERSARRSKTLVVPSP